MRETKFYINKCKLCLIYLEIPFFGLMFANNVYKGVKKDRKNNMNKPLNSINISSTMRGMEVQSTVLFPDSVEWSSLRSIAGRFNSAGKSAYSVKKVEGGYEVTRTR